MTAGAAALVALNSGRTALGSLLLLVIDILILVWIFNIAERKGRHAIGWLILGFSQLALIVVALLPSKRTTDSYG